ncbi:MAG: Maf family protein [Aggregatilineales bacterium]
MRLILASGSPRRREILARLGWTFAVIRPDIDETPYPAEPPDQYVARLSREKALIVGSSPAWKNDPESDEPALIIAADTTVALDSAILGKPADAGEATAMLRQLRGRAHTVFTGITVCRADMDDVETVVAATHVHMRHYSDNEIARYVATGDPFDKAGSYAIQHVFFRPVERIEGCYANVMGLPLCTLYGLLATQGVKSATALTCDPAAGRCVMQTA